MYQFPTLDELKGFFSKKEGKSLLNNFTQFGVYQVISYLAPLITIPYLLRYIGVAKFGIISFAMALIYYFQIIVEYGFGITGIQMIAQSKNDSRKQSEIVSNVLIIQVLLFGICFLLLGILFLLIPKINDHKLIYLLYYGYVLANILLFTWFYVGVEKVKYVNIISAVSKLFYILLIIIFIKNEGDFVLVPIFYSGTTFLAGIISIIILRKKFTLRFLKPSKEILKNYLKGGWHIFVSNIAMNLYRNTNIIILGFFASDASVGIYSAGEKVVKAIQSTLSPITQTLYPFISRKKIEEPDKSIRYVSKMIRIMGLIGSIISILLFIFAAKIAYLLNGSDNPSMVLVIRITSFVILFGVLNFCIGIIFMTNYDMKKEFLKGVIIVGIFNVLICIVLCHLFIEIGAAVAFLISEFILLLILFYFINRNRIKWSPKAIKQ
ncbi:MAG: flippase [Candidatus Marinimicrobia bacterium]|nr:flippase [Candidatus Neomarinimicrobiota bacterium]